MAKRKKCKHVKNKTKEFSRTGSNRRPWAHKTHALPTELHEMLLMKRFQARRVWRTGASSRTFYSPLFASQAPKACIQLLVTGCVQMHLVACIYLIRRSKEYWQSSKHCMQRMANTQLHCMLAKSKFPIISKHAD